MKRIVWTLIIALALVAVIAPNHTQRANALINGSVAYNTPGSYVNYTVTLTPNSNDQGSGRDYFCVVTYNANSEVYDIDVMYVATGTTQVTYSNQTDSVSLGAYIEPLNVVLTDPDSPFSGSENTQAGADWCASFPSQTPDPDPDRDGDGVPDAGDTCPDVYGVGSDGCPLPPPDMDGDGILDVDDACPLVRGPASNKGCPLPVPGCDLSMQLTPDTVIGSFLTDVTLYWAPAFDKQTYPQVNMAAGKTVYVLGMDASGEFYKVVWGCKYLWAPVGAMGPNYDQVWQGWPLPTTVVQ